MVAQVQQHNERNKFRVRIRELEQTVSDLQERTELQADQVFSVLFRSRALLSR
eukprot:m.83793 g.83793  ORF g.83793 m.83793 type:complete len:53 (+) comp8318_c0_seq1:2146-2304(+)